MYAGVVDLEVIRRAIEGTGGGQKGLPPKGSCNVRLEIWPFQLDNLFELLHAQVGYLGNAHMAMFGQLEFTTESRHQEFNQLPHWPNHRPGRRRQDAASPRNHP